MWSDILCGTLVITDRIVERGIGLLIGDCGNDRLYWDSHNFSMYYSTTIHHMSRYSIAEPRQNKYFVTVGVIWRLWYSWYQCYNRNMLYTYWCAPRDVLLVRLLLIVTLRDADRRQQKGTGATFLYDGWGGCYGITEPSHYSLGGKIGSENKGYAFWPRAF